MEKKKYIYWKDDDMWLGYLEEYPDYMTQAETIEELQENLRDIYSDLTSGNMTGIKIRKQKCRNLSHAIET